MSVLTLLHSEKPKLHTILASLSALGLKNKLCTGHDFNVKVQYQSYEKNSLPVCHFMLNPLYIDGLFHCYMLDESIHHFRGVWSILSLSFYF